MDLLVARVVAEPRERRVAQLALEWPVRVGPAVRRRRRAVGGGRVAPLRDQDVADHSLRVETGFGFDGDAA